MHDETHLMVCLEVYMINGHFHNNCLSRGSDFEKNNVYIPICVLYGNCTFCRGGSNPTLECRASWDA